MQYLTELASIEKLDGDVEESNLLRTEILKTLLIDGFLVSPSYRDFHVCPRSLLPRSHVHDRTNETLIERVKFKHGIRINGLPKCSLIASVNDMKTIVNHVGKAIGAKNYHVQDFNNFFQPTRTRYILGYGLKQNPHPESGKQSRCFVYDLEDLYKHKPTRHIIDYLVPELSEK